MVGTCLWGVFTGVTLASPWSEEVFFCGVAGSIALAVARSVLGHEDSGFSLGLSLWRLFF